MNRSQLNPQYLDTHILQVLLLLQVESATCGMAILELDQACGLTVY